MSFFQQQQARTIPQETDISPSSISPSCLTVLSLAKAFEAVFALLAQASRPTSRRTHLVVLPTPAIVCSLWFSLNARFDLREAKLSAIPLYGYI